MSVTPVRLCCGQRHWGAQCPDGLVMCCLCFERVTVEELAFDPEGSRENVCAPCRTAETMEVGRRRAEAELAKMPPDDGTVTVSVHDYFAEGHRREFKLCRGCSWPPTHCRCDA